MKQDLSSNQQVIDEMKRYIKSEGTRFCSNEEVLDYLRRWYHFSDDQLKYAEEYLTTVLKKEALDNLIEIFSKYNRNTQTTISYQILYRDLKSRYPCTNENARYALDNCNINWNERALEIARTYIRLNGPAPKEKLSSMLKNKGFEDSQVSYATDIIGDLKEQAINKAKEEYATYHQFYEQFLKSIEEEKQQEITIHIDSIFLKNELWGFSYSSISHKLRLAGFEDELVKYGVDNSCIDWDQVALEITKELFDKTGYLSTIALMDDLRRMGFNEKQKQTAIDYANNLAIEKAKKTVKFENMSYDTLFEELCRSFPKEQAQYAANYIFNKEQEKEEDDTKLTQSELLGKFNNYFQAIMSDQINYETYIESLNTMKEIAKLFESDQTIKLANNVIYFAEQKISSLSIDPQTSTRAK